MILGMMTFFGVVDGRQRQCHGPFLSSSGRAASMLDAVAGSQCGPFNGFVLN